MRRGAAKAVAMGGVFAALAVTVMCLVGFIPVATYVCPLLCMLLGHIVLRACGRRIAWAWYVCVALLSLLLGPDKEAAAVFLFLGYYPIVKPGLDKRRFPWIWKLLLFNGAVIVLYGIMLHVLGLAQLTAEFQELGAWGIAATLALGNLTFFLTDTLLTRLTRYTKR